MRAQTDGQVTFDQVKDAYLAEDFAKAIDLSSKFLKIEPDNVDVRLVLARSLHIQGDKSQAWEQIEKSLALEKSSYVYETASDLASWEERFAPSLNYLKLARERDKDNDPILIAKYIRLLKLLGRFTEAKSLASKLEAKHGNKYLSYYQDVTPAPLPQEISLEGGLSDSDRESRLRRHLMLGYFNKNRYVDFGFGLTRDVQYQEVGINFNADAYVDIPIGKVDSYAHVYAARSNKKVFADYSLAADYHLGIGSLGDVGVGYNYSDYGSTLGRTWTLSALAYIGDFTPAVTYYWGPTDYVRDSESWLFRINWSVDEQWKLAPYFSFGREVDAASSGSFDITNFREWGGSVYYTFNLRWGVNASVWSRKEKLVNNKPTDETGGTLGLSYYFR